MGVKISKRNPFQTVRMIACKETFEVFRLWVAPKRYVFKIFDFKH